MKVSIEGAVGITKDREDTVVESAVAVLVLEVVQNTMTCTVNAPAEGITPANMFRLACMLRRVASDIEETDAYKAGMEFFGGQIKPDRETKVMRLEERKGDENRG